MTVGYGGIMYDTTVGHKGYESDTILGKWNHDTILRKRAAVAPIL